MNAYSNQPADFLEIAEAVRKVLRPQRPQAHPDLDHRVHRSGRQGPHRRCPSTRDAFITTDRQMASRRERPTRHFAKRVSAGWASSAPTGTRGPPATRRGARSGSSSSPASGATRAGRRQPAGARRLHQDGPEVRGLQQDRRRLLRLAAGGGRLPARPAAGFAAEVEAHPARRGAPGVAGAVCARASLPSSARTASGARRRAARAPRALRRAADGRGPAVPGASIPELVAAGAEPSPAIAAGAAAAGVRRSTTGAPARFTDDPARVRSSAPSRRRRPRGRSAGRATGAAPITTSTLSGAGVSGRLPTRSQRLTWRQRTRA